MAIAVGVKVLPADPTVAAGVPPQAMPMSPVIVKRAAVVITCQQDFPAVVFLHTWAPRTITLSRQR